MTTTINPLNECTVSQLWERLHELRERNDVTERDQIERIEAELDYRNHGID